MYDKMFADMKERMQPMVDLAETNKKTMESLAMLQKDSMTEMVNSSVEQFKALSQCKDPQSALELQIKYYKTMESKMTETCEKSLSTMNEAKDAFVSMMEDSAKKTTAEMEDAMSKVSGKAA